MLLGAGLVEEPKALFLGERYGLPWHPVIDDLEEAISLACSHDLVRGLRLTGEVDHRQLEGLGLLKPRLWGWSEDYHCRSYALCNFGG